MKRKIFITIVVLLILVASKFWIGIYDDDEFSETYPFVKHRPIWKTFFYSPRGMSDRKLSDMSINEQQEQLLFDEFVLENLIIP